MFALTAREIAFQDMIAAETRYLEASTASVEAYRVRNAWRDASREPAEAKARNVVVAKAEWDRAALAYRNAR